jgi:predicted acetyltransferase
MTASARAALPEEAEAVLETLCLAFGLDIHAARPIFYADPYFDLSCKRVLPLPGAGIVSCLTVVPTTLRIGGVPVPAAGIAGVATRPAFQRRGYAAALLAATVPALCTELGFSIALLHPVSAPFYQKLGWEYASRSIRWLTVPASFPASPEAACVRPASEGDWAAIEALHDRQTRGGTGSFQRDVRRWRLIQMPVPSREAFVYERGGEISGYCVWERHDVLHLLELAGSTDDARRGLLGFLAGQPDALLEWSASPALLDRFGLSGAGLTPEPGVMLRLVDLEAALSLLHTLHYAPALAKLGTTLTIHAADPLYLRNTQPLRLSAEGISRNPRTDGPCLHADIRVLARLYIGDLLPSDAAAENLLATDSPETLGIADRLFPLREPYVAPLDQF